jgi:hypothetical protein
MGELERSEQGFLNPEWKKFILPVFLIILFGYQTHIYFSLGNFGDEAYCYSVQQVKLIEKYSEENNTGLLTETANELQSQIFYLDRKYNLDASESGVFYISSSISKIYPFFPVSCEVPINPNKFCRYYFTRESYDCTLEMYNITAGNIIFSVFDLNIPEYKKVSNLVIILHFILIFIWGYLISAVILFAFRGIKRKIKSS